MKKCNLFALIIFIISSLIGAELDQDTTDFKYHDFVIVIPTYNAIEWYQKCLDSVREQDYPREKVTAYILDDCSTDGQAEAIERYIQDNNEGDRFYLIKNTQKWWPAGNRWRANHWADPEAVIIDYDGDDWFAHPHVLSRVNEEYNKGDVLVTWGQWQSYPQNKIGTCRFIPEDILKSGKVRSYHPEGTEPNTLATGHLRTYKAWLYQQIKFKDFLFKGEIYRTCCDVQTMLTLLEMAQERSRFIPDVLYIYNCINPISAWRTKLATQRAINNHIRSQKPYPRIDQKPAPSFKVTMITIVENPLKLHSYLESIQQYTQNVHRSFILIASKHKEHPEYKRAQALFTHNIYVEYEQGELWEAIKQLAEQSEDYIVLATEKAILSAEVDLILAARALHKTHAHAFYLSTNPLRRFFQYNKCLVPIDEGDLAAWQNCYANQTNKDNLALAGTLYNKESILNALEQNSVRSVTELSHALVTIAQEDDLGLVYQTFVKGLVPEPQVRTSSYMALNWYTVILLLLFGLGVGIVVVRPNLTGLS